MPIQFTPTFFTRPTTAAPTAVSSSVHGMSQDSGRDSNQKHVIDRHNKKRFDPLHPQESTSILSKNNQRVEDIDWTHHESIMQNGTRVKFGAPRFTE